MDRGVGEALRGLPPPRRHAAPRRAAGDGRPYRQKTTTGDFRRPNEKKKATAPIAVILASGARPGARRLWIVA